MARELKPIDVGNIPELLSLAQEVSRSQRARVLRRDGEDLALVTPLPSSKRSTKGRAVTEDDSLFRLIGIGRSGIPGGVSGRKHEYLAEAHRQHR